MWEFFFFFKCHPIIAEKVILGLLWQQHEPTRRPQRDWQCVAKQFSETELAYSEPLATKWIFIFASWSPLSMTKSYDLTVPTLHKGMEQTVPSKDALYNRTYCHILRAACNNRTCIGIKLNISYAQHQVSLHRTGTVSKQKWGSFWLQFLLMTFFARLQGRTLIWAQLSLLLLVNSFNHTRTSMFISSSLHWNKA